MRRNGTANENMLFYCFAVLSNFAIELCYLCENYCTCTPLFFPITYMRVAEVI